MRLTLRQLQIFRAVSVSGSTSAAASNLGLSQSATSAALNELERGLDAQLFDRVGKRLVLNDSGRTLLPAALTVLDGARSIETAFHTGASDVPTDLRIVASTTIGNYLLPQILARYLGGHPHARFELRIGNTRDVANAVGKFDADMGLIEGPCHEPDLLLSPWRTDELVIVAAPTHPLSIAAKRRPVTARELRAVRWLLREAGSGTREAVEHALLPHLGHLGSAMILGSSEAIKYAAAEGLGLSCLSRCVVHDLIANQRLRVLATRLPRLTRRFSLIYHRNKVLSASLASFIEHCHDVADPQASPNR